MSAVQLQKIRASLAALPIGPQVVDFLNYLSVEAGLSPNTILAYGRDLRAFLLFCSDSKIKNIAELKAPLIGKYIHKISKAEFAEASINRTLVAVKMFLRYARDRKWLDDVSSEILEGPKLWQRIPVIASRQHVAKLLAAPDRKEPYCLRDRAMLELLYATGMRAGELAGLKISDVNLKIGYLRCFGKGRKERIVPLNKAAIAVCEEYLQELRPKLAKPAAGDAFLLSRTGRPLGRIELWRLVKKYALRAGMPKNLTTHTIRHCFATHLLAGGADLRTVQEMLGHANIATTQIYTHVDQDRLRAIHKKYHPLEKNE
ncbi:MAG TPA: tyrosine recombinase [Sedimentisphaerales bacterium]|nr:tyrosine recombinase [Sedimentisphaerales bacterium]